MPDVSRHGSTGHHCPPCVEKSKKPRSGWIERGDHTTLACASASQPMFQYCLKFRESSCMQDSRGLCQPKSLRLGSLRPGNEARDLKRLTRTGLDSCRISALPLLKCVVLICILSAVSCSRVVLRKRPEFEYQCPMRRWLPDLKSKSRKCWSPICFFITSSLLLASKSGRVTCDNSGATLGILVHRLGM